MTQIMNSNMNIMALETPPKPSLRLYMLWGEKKIRQMVRYHHYLLRLSDRPDFFSEDESEFEHATLKTADFFIEVLSKGRFSQDPYPYPALKMRHFQITVDEDARDIWLNAYKTAIRELNMPSECIEDFWNWIEPLSLWFVNRRNLPEIPRYPYKDIWLEFVDLKHMKRCS